ncbi:hypothetical protein [Streptomyces violaceus]|uniref:Uncharacterized protein n=1 Tax=Streptomyces violaceus TaxID=1936 RepID=A0ABZ1NJV1_STRVL
MIVTAALQGLAREGLTAKPGRSARVITTLAGQPKLHHEYPVTGLAALRAGALTADAVAPEARKADEAPAATADPEPDRARATSWPNGGWPTCRPTRPLPSVGAYDQLLRPRRPDRSATEGETP